MATEPQRMAGVVAIGDDAERIRDAFAPLCRVVIAQSMSDAVREAAAMSSPGVDVLLSPGCTSFDWYNNYNERGDDFQRIVRMFFSDAVQASPGVTQ
jgi:UDP-N-acetylmuramoylalanine--D-glutamate ligase